MSDTPTGALVEEADLDTLTDVIELGAGFADVPHDVARALDESCPHCAYDCMELPTRVEHGNWRCQRRAHVYPVVPQKWLGAIREVREDRQQKRQEAQERADYAAAVRRAEAERDAALKQSAAWEIQAQDMRDRLIKAEAERNELRATVTRLNRRAQTAEAGVRDNVEACKAAGVSMGRTLANAAADMYLRRAEKAEAERDAQHALVLRLTAERDAAREALAQKHLSERQSVRYVISRRDARIAELTATRDLLTAENARLQERVATLQPRRGGK